MNRLFTLSTALRKEAPFYLHKNTSHPLIADGRFHVKHISQPAANPAQDTLLNKHRLMQRPNEGCHSEKPNRLLRWHKHQPQAG